MSCPYCGEMLHIISKEEIECSQCEALWREVH